MGAPAAVVGDLVSATCPVHQIPNPASGIPQPGPPMPFSAPILTGVAATVLIGGKPAVVAGNTGVNTPPHVGLHASDPFMAPPLQLATVTTGSPTVFAEGRPMATATSTCTVCAGTPGQLAATGATVLIG
jgi:uncharacterized Zn-binding protein involved in type VI secretion